eukprot:CAMPEP_0113900628 /NCGR_PEP_ID=MMETSP0780_2-20120614/20788_1 /TAXON_ID=652834 /ORGANISM="Palpitomonas bilix" /LENGTH=241 /DNA_ID=CAMNT_0000893119 /DNA_START=263 /DNA_END=985 /DNA_ORIENTATION=+ /assembly_acc=CAM_ASM_000599
MAASGVDDAIFPIKRIKFLGREVPILLQNVNGPCPLLAMANALLLKNEIQIRPSLSFLTVEELLSILTVRLTDNPPKFTGEQALGEHLMQDVIEILPKLTRGMDLNVKFSGPEDFEYTSEINCFDMFGLRIFHGWIVDADDTAHACIRQMSYNKAVEMAIRLDAASPHPHSSTPTRDGEEVRREASGKEEDEKKEEAEVTPFWVENGEEIPVAPVYVGEDGKGKEGSKLKEGEGEEKEEEG